MKRFLMPRNLLVTGSERGYDPATDANAEEQETNALLVAENETAPADSRPSELSAIHSDIDGSNSSDSSISRSLEQSRNSTSETKQNNIPWFELVFDRSWHSPGILTQISNFLFTERLEQNADGFSFSETLKNIESKLKNCKGASIIIRKIIFFTLGKLLQSGIDRGDESFAKEYFDDVIGAKSKTQRCLMYFWRVEKLGLDHIWSKMSLTALVRVSASEFTLFRKQQRAMEREQESMLDCDPEAKIPILGEVTLLSDELRNLPLSSPLREVIEYMFERIQ